MKNTIYAHEHLTIDLSGVKGDADCRMDDRDLVLGEMKRLAAAGAAAVVDQTCRGMGRNPDYTQGVADEAGLRVIHSTGYYKEPFLPKECYSMSREDMAALFVKELTQGMEGTSLKAGLIGEIGTGKGQIAPIERQIFEAASMAHRETGAPICTHTTLGTLGLEQLEIFRAYGVDLSRVVLSHIDLSGDVDYMLRLLDSGVNIAFDTVGKNNYQPDQGRMDWLTALGFSGAVAVEAREALCYKQHGIPLGNIGHLVQIPDGALPTLLDARPQIITIYSVDKARTISALAAERGMVQDVMLRVVGKEDMLYSGQLAGFPLEDLAAAAEELAKLPNIRLAGVCAFPCFLYDEAAQDIAPTPNAGTVVKAAELLRGMGFPIEQVNMPSASCARSIPMVAAAGGTHAEPGHGLTGTTPWHLTHSGEQLALVYLSEVSHNFDGKGYCYGGGYYRRGHMSGALVGRSGEQAELMGVEAPTMDSIDYHFTLERPCRVGDAVVMSFRTQIFVTRSDMALVEGLSTGTPRITAVYDALGNRKV